ncbi:MAG: HD domain-containing protein, partial [Syntrophorhabdaceae bacterium]|nr:HD domain-containing protein [Syntrophorhabdaceae bacterium]
IEDLFLVRNKAVYQSKNNTKYMAIELKDRTGTIDAKIWDQVDYFSGLFEKNDIVRIRAKSRLYSGRPQLTILDIKKFENEMSVEDFKEFFPSSEKDIEVLKDEYFSLVEEIQNPFISSFFSVFNSKVHMRERFFMFPASIGVHHMYIGGLLEHSVNVASIASKIIDITGGDKDIIIAGSLIHDIGKIEEMEFAGRFKYSDRGRLLGHIGLGITIFESLIKEIDGFPPYIADMLTHIIISHHGTEEWGSPRKPMSIEALIVHYIDNLDAKITGVKEHMKEKMEDERWTEYHRLYESRFYKTPER